MSGRVRVLEPGMMTTVQDLGRFGYGHLGVSASGAADPLSARLANRIVGNPDNAPVLEMTLMGGIFAIESEMEIALAGSDFGAILDGTPMRTLESLRARAGAMLHCGPTRSGARAYLAFSGGIEVPHILGSASIHVMSGVGGRPLKRGDLLRIGGAESRVPQGFQRAALETLAVRKQIRITRGPQWERFGEKALEAFCSASWEVSEDSNRMGLRLKGEQLETTSEAPTLTEGVALGAIQIPPGGEPIILFVEQQTTGGYPKIANVISADMHSVGQLRPRDEVTFELVTIAEAVKLLREQEAALEAAFHG